MSIINHAHLRKLKNTYVDIHSEIIDRMHDFVLSQPRQQKREPARREERGFLVRIEQSGSMGKSDHVPDNSQAKVKRESPPRYQPGRPQHSVSHSILSEVGGTIPMIRN